MGELIKSLWGEKLETDFVDFLLCYMPWCFFLITVIFFKIKRGNVLLMEDIFSVLVGVLRSDVRDDRPSSIDCLHLQMEVRRSEEEESEKG